MSEQLQELVVSVAPAYMRAILEGRKEVEFRRTNTTRPISRIFFCETGTQGYIRGYAPVKAIQRLTPLEAWNLFSGVGGVTSTEFFTYLRGKPLVTCIQFGAIVKKTFHIAELGLGRAPQSLAYIPLQTDF